MGSCGAIDSSKTLMGTVRGPGQHICIGWCPGSFPFGPVETLLACQSCHFQQSHPQSLPDLALTVRVTPGMDAGLC